MAGPLSPMAPKIGKSAMHTATCRAFMPPHEIAILASETRTASPEAPAMTCAEKKPWWVGAGEGGRGERESNEWAKNVVGRWVGG